MDKQAQETAAAMIARLRAGFSNEHHWQNWKRTHGAAVNALPVLLREKVWLEWENATAKEFSR